MIRWRVVAVALFCVAGLISCRDEQRPRFRKAPVIIISIDSLRADRLPLWGYTGVSTPAIDKFGRDAVQFTRAYSQSPMTLPSHVTMLSGTLPAAHGVRLNEGHKLVPSKAPWLPCVLREARYRIGAAVSSSILAAGTNVAACFDEYDDAIVQHPALSARENHRSGFQTLEIAKKWLSANGHRPFFYFFHINEPHAPYTPAEEFRDFAPYDGEVATADAIVGGLLDYLRESGIYDRAIVVITSGHGEGLGDHGEEQHSVLLYREAIHVPLLVKLPKSEGASRRRDDVAAISDLAPTLLELLRIDVPERMTGSDLFAAGARTVDRAAFAETLYPRVHFGWSPLASLIRGRFHYIQGPDPELYDLIADPLEKKNVIANHPRVAYEMATRVEKLWDGGGVSVEGVPLPNPREQIELLEEIRLAQRLLHQRKHEQSRELLGRLLEENREMPQLWMQLARMESAARRPDAAIAAYRRAVTLMPVVGGETLVAMGALHLQKREFAEAERLARSAVGDTPAKAWELLARIALAQGKSADAESFAATAVALRPAVPSSYVVLAQVQLRTGAVPQALASLSVAEKLAGRARVYDLDFVRGEALLRMGRSAEAIEAYRREIGTFPDNLEAYAALALAHAAAGRKPAARAVLEEMVERNRSPAAGELARKLAL